MSAYKAYLAGGNAQAIPNLKETYAGQMNMGMAVGLWHLTDPDMSALLRRQLSSLTCENDMKPERLLDHAATLKTGECDRAAITLATAEPYLDYARRYGLTMRFHVLVWHNQTPRWFFAEGFSADPEAPLVSPERLLVRQANYIRDVMQAVNARWADVVSAWDVVNEAIEETQGGAEGFRTRSLWYQVLGTEFIEPAFAAARKYAAPHQKLFYNDYNSFAEEKQPHILPILKRLKDKGLIDGMGMQSHIMPDWPSDELFDAALRRYAALGLTIHVTELDVHVVDGSPLSQMALAARYRCLMDVLLRARADGIDVANVTLWGATDGMGWWNRHTHVCHTMLFDDRLAPKAAFFGMLRDEAIPASHEERDLLAAMDELSLPRENLPLPALKRPGEHNPVMVQRFGADPWVMVHNDRAYLYMTGDVPTYDDQGRMTTNHYGAINTIRVLWSDDLVNWTDAGDIPAAGERGAAKWARNSWAPAAACKVVDGRERFFLYFADSGRGIGVLASDSPTGPFTDPIGGPLVSRDTPNCADVVWLFDPAVLVDDDGRAYLYVGGGVPEGQAAHPRTARCVELGEDMISLKGDPQPIDAPFLFEDSGINRCGDTYVYSYCSNFDVTRSGGSEHGLEDGEIQIMTAPGPLGPFTYAGRVLRNPQHFFGVGGNNHHCMFNWGEDWYVAYHTQALEHTRVHTGGGYRNTHIDRLCMMGGLPAATEATLTGVEQRRCVDAFAAHGPMAANLAGVTAEHKDGAMSFLTLCPGSWTAVYGVDFSGGAAGLTLDYQARSDARVRIVLDDVNAAPVAEIALPAVWSWNKLLFALDAPITGRHDVYFLFDEVGVNLRGWQFHRTEEVVRGDNPITGTDLPDPDVIRVGDAYYMVSTTMYFMPGCVLLRSYDLIHWEYVSRVYDVLEDTPRQRLEAGNAYGAGMWAASLRYHKGTFYVCFVANDTHKTYLFRSESVTGPWRRSEIKGFYHDCSLLFDDDDRVYVAYGGGQIHLTELESDLSGPRAGGLDRIIADYGEGGPLGYEGSHLYKINGRYYLFVIHSLKDRWRRVESCFVSDSLTGDFRGGVVLDDDMGLRPDGVAQGALVDTPDGRWFALLFQDNGAAGRVPVLMPVLFERGFPRLGLMGKVPLHPCNLTTRPGHVYAPLVAGDDFTAPALTDVWEWNHIPVPALVATGDGTLRLRTAGVTDTLTATRNILTQRACLPSCAAEVTLDASGLNEGDVAGLCVLQDQWGYVGAERTADGLQLILRTRREGDDAAGEVRLALPLTANEVRLRAELRFSAEADEAAFLYRSGEGWQPLGVHPVRFLLSHFTGNRFGLFVQSTRSGGGEAAFRDFAYETPIA